MSIYTKTGDDGTTSLFDGKRILKSEAPVEAYGSVDELSSFIGLLIGKIKNKDDKTFITEIQNDLYQIMSLLAGAKIKNFRVGEKVKKIEKKIDFLEKKLPKINHFILPQGTEISCLFHIVRAICRRAERKVVNCFNRSRLPILKYLNRLSDLFFIFSRWYNRRKEIMIK